MADKKISELEEATEVDEAAFVPVVQDGENKKMSLGTLLGATSFTDLTDATNAVAGKVQTELERNVSSSITFSAAGLVEEVGPIGSASITASSNYGADGEEADEAGAGEARLDLSATSHHGGDVQVSLKVVSEQDAEGVGTKTVILSKTAAAPFKMENFDVAASDATATLTVNAVEYSVAKALKINIGDDTYFAPLFGPVVL